MHVFVMRVLAVKTTDETANREKKVIRDLMENSVDLIFLLIRCEEDEKTATNFEGVNASTFVIVSHFVKKRKGSEKFICIFIILAMSSDN